MKLGKFNEHQRGFILGSALQQKMIDERFGIAAMEGEELVFVAKPSRFVR